MKLAPYLLSGVVAALPGCLGPSPGTPAAPGGCAVTPADAGGEPVVVAYDHGTYKDWGTIIADAACDGRPVRFEGGGYTFYRHVAIWLQGAGTSWMPGGPLDGGRVPGAVLLGEADVVGGRIAFTRRFAPAIGPTSDCGTMALTPGARYGLVTVADGAFSSFMAIDVPTRPCLAADVPPVLRLTPESPCGASTVAVAGEGFAPGPVVLQLWKLYVPAPGEFYSGKAPPQETALGEVAADADGRFTFTWTPALEAGRGRYVLRALDRGKTRLTTRELETCP